jgi:hypothetical protein
VRGERGREREGRARERARKSESESESERERETETLGALRHHDSPDTGATAPLTTKQQCTHSRPRTTQGRVPRCGGVCHAEAHPGYSAAGTVQLVPYAIGVYQCEGRCADLRICQSLLDARMRESGPGAAVSHWQCAQPAVGARNHEAGHPSRRRSTWDRPDHR